MDDVVGDCDGRFLMASQLQFLEWRVCVCGEGRGLPVTSDFVWPEMLIIDLSCNALLVLTSCSLGVHYPNVY